MEDLTRFELLLPLERRVQLDELADANGLSTAALARLAIVQLIEHPPALLKSAATDRAA